MSHNNDSVRNKLIEITNQGLMLKSIALNAGIDVNDLSRFKGGMECLKESEVNILSEYLNAVVIPQWNKSAMEHKKGMVSQEIIRDNHKVADKKPTKWEVMQRKMRKRTEYQ